MTAHVNSKVLGVLDPHQVSSVMKSTPAFAGGYPVPGPQSPTVTSAMNKDCFVDENTWRLIAENGEFDDIVVGSGFCALAYIDEALRLDPFRKILLLERGGFWLPDHFQNLPLPFQFVSHDVSETFPWELTSETVKEKLYLNGSSPFFGGRSSFWSIWSPHAIGKRASTDTEAVNLHNEKTRDKFNLMDGFPKFMKEIAKKPDFYKDVERLLHVKPANKIEDPVYKSVLQKQFDRYLRSGVPAAIPGALCTEPARLATGVPIGLPTQGFRQFSAVGSLLSINEWQNKLARQNPPAGNPIMIATDVIVERFEVEGPGGKPTHARVLHTSRGPLTLRGGKTKVILATGAIPATTILLNSLDETLKIRARTSNPLLVNPTGKRFTSHFRSQIKARFKPGGGWVQQTNEANVPPDVALLVEGGLPTDRPVISASHLRGRDQNNGNLQWHIQIHGSYIPTGYQERGLSVEEKARLYSRLFTSLAPDNGDTLTPEQAKNSDGYVLVSCSVLGEHPKGTPSQVELNQSNPDVTTNIRLHLDLHTTPPSALPKDSAIELWKTMEGSTFRAIEAIATNHEAGTLQYWNREDVKWETVNGDLDKSRYINRVRSLFHEASTTFMAEDFTTARGAGGSAEKADIKYASVDKTYRPRGLEKGNVYVTGAGLFPTAGSWNPTPTIVGFAQHLAKTLVVPPKRVGVITKDQPVSTTKTLGRPYIVGFKIDGSVTFWSFSGQQPTPPSNRPGTHNYRNDRHVRLLADTTGKGFYDLVVFGDTGVHIATRHRIGGDDKFNNFVTVQALEHFTYSAGWRTDKHTRYMADVRKTGRADIIGFGEAGVVLSLNEPEPADTAVTTTREAVQIAATAAGATDAAANAAAEAAANATQLALAAGGSPAAAAEAAAEAAEDAAALQAGIPDDAVTAARDAAAVPRIKFTLPTTILHDLCYDKGWRLDRHPRILADFHGQGFPDIIGFGETSVVLAKNHGNGTFEDPRNILEVKEDLTTQDLTEFTYSTRWRANRHVRTLANMTSKDHPDIVGFGDKGVYLAVNKGDGTVERAKLVLTNFGYNQNWRVEKHLRILVDLNGDGFGDIVGFGKKGVYVSKNRGNGRFEETRLVSRDFGYDQGWRIEKHLRFVVDVTGSGCADIVGFKDDQVYVAFNDGQGNFGHSQSLGKSPERTWTKDWDPSTTAGYVTRLGHELLKVVT